ncbi:MAG: extracellular solute-binding protein [Treponema sp.]|nr:extracellular solute-binding protein [Treponema sp.]
MHYLKSKITVLLIAAMLLCSTAAVFASGGQSGSAGTAQPITVKFWGGVPPENGPQAVVDAFNAEFKGKGIQAEYTRFVNDDNGNLLLETNLLSADSVDVFMNYNTNQVSKRSDSGMTLDYLPLIARDKFDIAGFGAENVAQCNFNGKLYAFPTVKGVGRCTMINKDMFDAAGIPVPTHWTYSEFRDIAKRLTSGSGANKVYGAFFNTGQFIDAPLFHFQNLLPDWQYAADLKSTRYNQEPAVKEAIQFAVNVMNDGSAPTHADTVTQKLTQEGMFLSGRAAMTFGAWIVRNVKDTVNYPHNFVTAFAPYPVSDQYTVINNDGGVGDFISINPKSKNTDAAWEFVKWYTTKGIVDMAAGGRIGLYAGLDQKVLTDAFLAGSEKLLDPATTQSIYFYVPQDIKYAKVTLKAPELTQIWSESLEAIYNGRMTVEAGMADCEARANKVLVQ